MENTNMVGMTNDEVIIEAASNAAGCLVASLFGAALLACALGWVVYLACVKFPALGSALPPAGLMALGAAAHMVWSSRNTRNEAR